jgi:transcriptional regulator with XRE-family HTH domain
MTQKQLQQIRAERVGHTGNRIAAAFRITERPQMDCAREFDLTPQYISDVKAGRFQNISVENAHKFAAFFGCAIEDLFPAREAVAS